MKNLILITTLLINSFCFANEKENLVFNENEVSSVFVQLEPLENFIEAHPELSAETIIAEKPDLVEANVDLNITTALGGNRDLPLASPFWWGCCLNVAGLLVVYIITDNDRGQVKSALWGCILSSIFFGGGLLGYLTDWF